MKIACDIDGMVKSYPEFFQYLIPGLQSEGCEVGLLTGIKEDQSEIVIDAFKKKGITLDFAYFKPEELNKLPNGVWKAVICRYKKIDYLFDDFQHDNPEFVADFIETIGDATVPFTTIMSKNKPDANGNTLKDYVEEIIQYLEKNPIE